MLGQPVRWCCRRWSASNSIGTLNEGATATDLVLTVTQMLRKKGVVGQLRRVSSGPGSRPSRSPNGRLSATWRPNTALPAACFQSTPRRCDYLAFTGRDPEQVALVEAYAKAQGMWRDESTPDPDLHGHLELDLGTSNHRSPGRSGRRIACRSPRRSKAFLAELPRLDMKARTRRLSSAQRQCAGTSIRAQARCVVIAAITSCTNTSNPSVMLAAGLLAQAMPSSAVSR